MNKLVINNEVLGGAAELAVSLNVVELTPAWQALSKIGALAPHQIAGLTQLTAITNGILDGLFVVDVVGDDLVLKVKG